MFVCSVVVGFCNVFSYTFVTVSEWARKTWDRVRCDRGKSMRTSRPVTIKVH